METDFGFDDDYVIETALKESLAELRSSRLHTAGPPPDSEKPQKPFGLHSFPTPEEEAAKARRNPTTQGDRLFSEETARRGEEQSRKLAALNTSQASMDDGSLGSAEDTEEIISPPKSRTTSQGAPSPMPPSRDQDDLDDSLQLMMHKATLSEAHREKKEHRRKVQEAPRPASAEPGRVVEDRRGGGGRGDQQGQQGGDRRSFGNSNKRLSHHRHLSERSHSHSKSSFSASHSSMNQVLDTSRTSRTSSELTSGSSRLNTSQESNHRMNTSFEASSSARSPHMQRSGRQGSSAREGRATPESRQRISSRGAEDGRTTPSSRQKRQESGRETPETARQRRLQEESRRVVEARRAQEESRRAQEEQVSQRRSQEQSQRRSQEQSHRRKEEMQGATKKSSYYFGEEPELSNGGIDLHDEEDSLTPTEERDGVREHAGEVVRIRVPYTEQDLTQQYNIQRLNAQKISPRFNGHKVTIQVNHGDGAPRLDDSFSSDPPLSPSVRRDTHSRQQERVGSSNCLHTTTHAMFVGEPGALGNGEASRSRRAPLAQQELEAQSQRILLQLK